MLTSLQLSIAKMGYILIKKILIDSALTFVAFEYICTCIFLNEIEFEWLLVEL